MGVRNLLTGAGAVVGSFFGQPQLGLAIGSLIGNIVDPQRIKGPALKEFPVLGVTEGAYRQVAYGTTIIRDCQLLDWGPLDPVIVEEQQGKGGGPVVESQRLYQTYFIGIGEPIEAVRYIKRDGVMVYDLRPGSTILPESADFAGRLRIYLGGEDQLPDPDLEALPHNGVGNTPSYRGTSGFAVIRDDLTDLGGRIPTYEVGVQKVAGLALSNVTLITEKAYYSGPPSSLQVESSIGFGGSITSVAVSPDGIYAVGSIPTATSAGRFEFRKFDPATETWGALAAPGGVMTHGPRYMVWHPSEPYIAIGNIKNGGPDRWRVYKVVADELVIIAEPSEYMSNGTEAFAWSDDGTLLAVSNQNSGQTLGVYDFNAATGVISGLRKLIGTMGPGGQQTRYMSFQPGPNPRYLAVAGNEYLHVIDFVNDPVDVACLISTDDIRGFVAWNPAGTHLITLSNVSAPWNLDLWAFDDTYGAESLSFVGSAASPTSSFGVGYHQTPNRQHLAIVVNTISSSLPPEIYSISSDATPVITKLTNPANAGGVIASAWWAAASPVVQYDDNAVPLSAIVADICDRCGIPAGKLDLSELTDEVKGLTLGGQYDGAGAITTLMPPYFFDLYEADKEVRAPKRGGAVKATITEADLVEDIDENSLRGQDIEYPRKLQLKYLNPGQNYAAPAAVFARTTPDVRVRGEASMDLPICMDETQALQAAERILKVMWEDLNGEVTLSLPAGPFAWLAPTDCLGLSIRGALFRIRVEKVEDVDGVLKVTARRDRQSAYTSVLTAIPLPPPEGPPPSLAGVTQFVVLNGPGIIDSDDRLGVRIGVCGLPGSAWSGATVRYSTDAGATWTTAATIRTAARLGQLTAGLPSNLAGYTDATNPLEVLLLSDRQLEAVTDLQLLQEGNGAAIARADGTCEVLQFRDVTDNGSRAWTLRHMPRGGLGTTASAHSIGAKFVMLDGTEFVPLPSALIGQTLRFQFVSLGTSPETAPIFDLVWNPAVAQTEFPPASLRLTRGSGVISATWAPRHRFGIDTGPVASVNFTGWRVTLTAGLVTQVHDVLAPSFSGSDAAFTGAITVTVQQLNRFTGAGPGTSGVI